jgi:hypothetical protein
MFALQHGSENAGDAALGGALRAQLTGREIELDALKVELQKLQSSFR